MDLTSRRMITRRQFTEINEQHWQDGEQAIESLGRRRGRISPEEARELPRKFRKSCQDLGVARERVYSPVLIARLNKLIMGLFGVLHRSRTRLTPVHFMTRSFPGAFRKNLGLFWISAALFWVPFFALFSLGEGGLLWMQSLLGQGGMESLEAMYGKSGDPLKHGRETYGSDFMAFAFYVYNNCSIGLRMFGGGVLWGVGTVFVSIFNGLHIGAAAGYVQAVGDPEKFWTFVSGHSAFELLGINIETMAGLRLGWGLIRSTQEARLSALIKNGREALVLLGGGVTLTFFAAFIEGFWSAQSHPAMLKYGVGIALWILTLAYLFTSRKEWYERS